MIWNRKLGVFELLVFITLFELVFVSRLGALFWGLGALLAYYAKKKFGGEFSLAQAWSVVTGAASEASKKIDGSGS